MAECVHVWVWEPAVGRFGCGQCGVVTAGCVQCAQSPPRPTAGPDVALCRPCHNYLGGLLGEAEQAAAGLTEVVASLGGVRGTAWDLSAVERLAVLPFGLDASVEEWPPGAGGPADRNRPTTVTGAVDGLGDVVEAWRAGGVEVGGWQDLRARLVWAAKELDPDLWAASVAMIVRCANLLRQRAGWGVELDDARCLEDECGGQRLVRAFTPGGLEEDPRCPSCDRVYDAFGLRQARLARLQEAPGRKPDALVREGEVRMVFPGLGESTVRVWLHRDKQAARRFKVAWDQWVALGEVGPEPVEPAPILPVAAYRDGQRWFRVGDVAAALTRLAREADTPSLAGAV